MYLLINKQRDTYILPKIFYMLFFFTMIFSVSFAQSKGSINGKVVDKTSSDVLIGANVIIVGSTLGASADLDGFYAIKNLEPDVYKIKFSFISYQSVVVENVKVDAGKNTKLDIQLLPASTELEEVVVTAEALKSTEGAILNIQKNSLNIVDGLSAELIGKNNSSDGTDVFI